MKSTTDWTDVTAITKHQQWSYYGVWCLYFLMSFLRKIYCTQHSVRSRGGCTGYGRQSENILLLLWQSWCGSAYKALSGLKLQNFIAMWLQTSSPIWGWILTKKYKKSSSHLEKGWFLQHVKELWEIVSNFLIHGSHKADLPHGSGPVRSWTVSPAHLGQDKQLMSFSVSHPILHTSCIQYILYINIVLVYSFYC